MSDLLSRFVYWLSGGRFVHRDNIPRGRIIIDAGGEFKVRGVRFFNVQIDLTHAHGAAIDGCWFDMTEMTDLGLDFTTVYIPVPIGDTDD